ncbi:olfactory receptor 6C2-like [Monodelphis domestica]|uniref:olfactory receptor 6C2-like n=1 Tax=Monodelphis domestica TaxID=13616 RepID=UPI00020F75D9|nr:olfactory receptor 6C2-like [Monodelphis domestica]
MKNHTKITLFILQGLTDDPQLQVLIFIFLFLTYMLSVTGNLTIITLTLVDPHLKTPMYFFLRNFSFLELLYTTFTVPMFLYNISSGDYTVTYNACFTQLFFGFLIAASEFFLLAVMSYDRYVAICKPLHYATIINSRVCHQLMVGCWLSGLMITLPPLSLFFELEYCDSNVINHFACDVSPMLEITCSDTKLIELMTIASAGFTLIITLVSVVLSYASIIRTILGFPSAQQRKKAFSTCSSHMIVLCITYGTCIFIYIQPSAKERMSLNKVLSLLVTSVAPVMNPFIYTLRNKQVIQAFRDLLKSIIYCSQSCKMQFRCK